MKSARLHFDVHSATTQERPPPQPSSCAWENVWHSGLLPAEDHDTEWDSTQYRWEKLDTQENMNNTKTINSEYPFRPRVLFIHFGNLQTVKFLHQYHKQSAMKRIKPLHHVDFLKAKHTYNICQNVKYTTVQASPPYKALSQTVHCHCD